MRIVCKKCPTNDKFSVIAHEAHAWIVDESGEFYEDKGCTDLTHKPDSQDHYTCTICGDTAEVIS